MNYAMSKWGAKFPHRLTWEWAKNQYHYCLPLKIPFIYFQTHSKRIFEQLFSWSRDPLSTHLLFFHRSYSKSHSVWWVLKSEVLSQVASMLGYHAEDRRFNSYSHSLAFIFLSTFFRDVSCFFLHFISIIY